MIGGLDPLKRPSLIPKVEPQTIPISGNVIEKWWWLIVYNRFNVRTKRDSKLEGFNVQMFITYYRWLKWKPCNGSIYLQYTNCTLLTSQWLARELLALEVSLISHCSMLDRQKELALKYLFFFQFDVLDKFGVEFFFGIESYTHDSWIN